MNRTLSILLTTALAAFGCDDDNGASGDTGGMGGQGGGEGGMGGGVMTGTSALYGRIDDDAGNQSTRDGQAKQAAGISADAVVIVTVDGSEVAEAAVDAAGRFRFDGLARIDGPFMVEARSQGEATGRVLVPMGLDDEQDMPVMPISAETTAEAQVFAELSAQGEPVDGIGVITRVSQEMAAEVDASLSDLMLSAQAAFIAALEANGEGEITVEQLVAARAEAFVALTAALDAAADSDAEAEAWVQWHIAQRAALEAALDSDAAAQSDAHTAASVAVSVGLEGDAGARSALQLTSELAARAHAGAIDAAVDGDAEAQAAADGAFARFFADLRAAADVQAVLDAEASLNAALTAEAGSVLAASLSDAETDAEVGLLAIGGATGVVEASAQAGIRAAIDAGAEGAAQGEAIAAAQGELRAQVEAMVSGQLDGTSAESSARLMAQLLVQGAFAPAEQADEPAPRGPAVRGDIVAEITGGLDLQSGARSIGTSAGALRVEAISGARVVVRDSEGAAIAAVAGLTADAEGYVIEMPAREMPEGVTSIEVVGEGGVIGSLLVERPPQDADAEPMQMRPIDAQTTVEARVTAEILARGEAADRNSVARFIDEAVARASLDGEGQLDATVDAVIMAQLALASTLDLTVEEMDAAGSDARAELEARLAAGGDASAEAHAEFYAELSAAMQGADADARGLFAQANAQAAAAFEVGVMAQGAADSALIAAADARAHIEAAITANAAMQAELMDAGVDAQAQLEAALTALVTDSAEAQDADEIEQAGADFDAVLTGEAGLLFEVGALISAGDVALEGIINAALAGALEASALGQADLTAALDAAVAARAAGESNANAADAVVVAFANLDASLINALSVAAFDEGSAAQLDALAAVFTSASFGLFGAF